jgi:hypothetical protein
MRIDFSGIATGNAGTRPDQPGAVQGEDQERRRALGVALPPSINNADSGRSVSVDISQEARFLLKAGMAAASATSEAGTDNEVSPSLLQKSLSDPTKPAAPRETAGAGSGPASERDDSVKAAQRQLGAAGFAAPST